MFDSVSDGDGIPDAQELLAPSTSAQGNRGTDPHDPASVLRLSQLDKTATGMQMQLSPLRHRRLAKPRLPTLTGNPFDFAQGTRTYRIEYTDDLTSNQWHPLTEPIPGDVGTLSEVEGANQS